MSAGVWIRSHWTSMVHDTWNKFRSLVNYKSDTKTNESINLLLAWQNDTIHATIDSKLLRIFKDGSVAEGTAYKFAKLTVARNNYSNKVTSHNFRIYFEAATTITKVEECNIARNKFQFVEFKDIIHHNVDKNQFIGMYIYLTRTGNFLCPLSNFDDVYRCDSRGWKL